MAKTTNEKRLFYIQLTENFFESEDMLEIAEAAEFEGINVNDLQLLYLKLIIKSLRFDGIIKSEKVLTPRSLKSKIGFKTGKGLIEDNNIVDAGIQILEDLGLISIEDNLLFVKKALLYTMNKLEDSERRLQDRREIELAKNRLLLKESKDLSDEEKEELNYSNFLKEKWLPGLIFKKYISSEESNDYLYVFDDLFEHAVSVNEINQAFDRFINRNVNIQKINDRKKYLLETLWHIVWDEVRTDGEYDFFANFLQKSGIVEKYSDIREFIACCKKYEMVGFERHRIATVATHVINNLQINETNGNIVIKSLISVFDSELNKKLKELKTSQSTDGKENE